MSDYEQEIQQNIERGIRQADDNADVKAYEKVFRALNRIPESSVSANFADRVITRIVERERKEERRDFVWFAIGLVLLLATFIGTIFYTGFTFELGFLEGMSRYSGLLLFGTIFILGLHWLDKRILRTRRFNQ
jgi:hypothetical protein